MQSPKRSMFKEEVTIFDGLCKRMIQSREFLSLSLIEVAVMERKQRSKKSELEKRL